MPSLLRSCLIAVGLASFARAGIVFDRSINVGKAPNFWFQPILSSDTSILGFDEAQGVLVPDGKLDLQRLNQWDEIKNLELNDIGSTPVDSHMIYFDKATKGKGRVTLRAEIEFDKPILGFIADDRLLAVSNPLFAPNPTHKKAPGDKPWSLEEEQNWTPLDKVTLLTPTRICIEWTNESMTDPLRVITASTDKPLPASAVGNTEDVRAALERYCIDCHDADTKKGGVDLDSLLHDDIGKHAETWEAVVKQLNARHMPPIGKKRPDEKGYDELIATLTKELDAQPTQRIAGPTFRRLTRTEYQNAVRDLLAVEFDAKAAFPTDEISHGFDNVTVGDLPPALLDRYIAAAQKIARQAVGTSTEPEITAVRLRPDITQEYHVPGLPLGTRGGVLVKHVFAQTGDYEVQVRLQRDRNEQVEGMNGPHQLQILLNRELKSEFTVKPAKDKNYEQIDAHLKTRFHVESGQHDLGVTFLPNSSPVLERMRQPYKASFNLHRHPRLSPAVYQVTITGPFQPQGAGDTPSRRLIFGEQTGVSVSPKAILMPIMRRAWRRDITDVDWERVLPFVREAKTLENGIESALAAILVSREFLFRAEEKADDDALASKLAFFLWSSLPDDELLSQRPLHLEAQTRRMLRDPRAMALVTNFADQWLYLRNLDAITPDARLFPDFDHNLRESLRSETSQLFADIIQNDRSVLDLLRTDRTWLDERLAAHYGIPHIHGSRFREVKLTPEWQRGGLLRHGSIQTVTSYATRTSPVIRGHWILKNLLATEPPPPPPNVPALDGVISESLPIRERLAKHREMAACASCHNLMDPVGFALENYDAIGRWRTEADARGGFADGSEFEGVTGLEEVLLKRPELFVTALTEKLMVYALGRGLEPSDAPAVRKIVRRAKDNGWKFSEIIVGIVTSPVFAGDEGKRMGAKE